MQATGIDADFQTAVDNFALEGVRLLTKWIAVAFAILLPLPFVRFPLPIASRLTCVQLGAILFSTLLGKAASRGLIKQRHGRAALAVTLSIPTFAHLVQSYIAYVPDRVATYGLVIVGIGIFCLSRGWLMVLLTAAVAGWGLLIWVIPEGGPTFIGSLVPLGVAVLGAGLAHFAGATVVERLEHARWEDRQHLKQAQANEAMFRGIMNRIHDVFFRTDINGTIEMVSPSVQRYGFRAEDLIGTNALKFYADVQQRERLLKLLISRGHVTNLELSFMRRDGEQVAATINVNPLLDENGRVIGLEGLLHDISERKLEEARQRAEAEDAATLAYVGQELIASLDEPSVLGRLCELTARVFECDASHTFLLDERGVIITAGHGDSQEEWESLRVLEIPADIAAPVMDRLRSEGVVQTVLREPRDPTSTPVPPGYGITAALYFPLRRREEIVGFQSAAFRGRTDPLDERKVRLARRIAHLASLALENARLVDALARANQFKTRFLANMSHELRTPLNVILGYNQILLDEGCGPLSPEQAAMLERVQGNAGELLDMVCATLELSREESRQFPIEIHKVEIPALMDSLAEERRALASSRGLRLHFHTTANLQPLHTDPRKLRMVLKNLIDNAVKFTENGSITVAAEPSDGGVQFRVSDTGIGIRPEDMEAIFEPFRQGATAAGSLDGVGLGLYIVRTLLKALKGTVEAESEPGRGSSFRIWLPWRIEAEPGQPSEQALMLGWPPTPPHQRTQ